MGIKKKRRQYKLCYNLRRRGFVIHTNKKMVIRHSAYTPTTERWCRELANMGFGVAKYMFLHD